VADRRGWARLWARNSGVPPHSKLALRRAAGLEAAIIDYAIIEIRALDPADHRVFPVKVAGPAALLVAKLHKLGERDIDARWPKAPGVHAQIRLLRSRNGT